MNSIPFGYIVSLCSQSSSKAFRVLADEETLKPVMLVRITGFVYLVHPPGLFHYMNSIPFGYIVSLCSQSSSKAFRVLADEETLKPVMLVRITGFVYLVHPPGLEPGTTVPKTAVISISPRVQLFSRQHILPYFYLSEKQSCFYNMFQQLHT